MKQAYKKRPPRATANSPRFCWIWEKLLYKSGKFMLRNRFALITHKTLSDNISLCYKYNHLFKLLSFNELYLTMLQFILQVGLNGT